MDDKLLHTLLNKTGKARFVDWAPYCLDLEKTKDIISKIIAQKEYGYTQKSYETRVHNTKCIIKSGRLEDALIYIIDRSQVKESTKTKALALLDGVSLKNINNPQSPSLSYRAIPEGMDKLSQIKIRVGQSQFRHALIDKWKSCSVTGCSNLPLLIASHIKPWAKCTAEEKTNVNNGLLLLPNLDKLFDKGYISFDDNGYILISKNLNDPNIFGVDRNMKLSQKLNCNKFIRFHREHVFI